MSDMLPEHLFEHKHFPRFHMENFARPGEMGEGQDTVAARARSPQGPIRNDRPAEFLGSAGGSGTDPRPRTPRFEVRH